MAGYRHILFSSSAALIALTFSACTTYKPGAAPSTLPEGSPASVWVAPALNQSYMPQLALAVTERIRDAFMDDMSMPLVRRDVADMKLEVVIVNVSRVSRAAGLEVLRINEEGMSWDEDSGLSQAIDVVVEARATLTDNHSGAVLLDKVFSASSQHLPSPYRYNSADGERLLLPILARELARQIHESVAGGWTAPKVQ
jgi:hypothetical protein